MFFAFFADKISKDLLYLPCAHFLAAVCLQAFAEKEFKAVSTKFCLHKFAVGHTAYCGNIQVGTLGNILKDHGAQICFITGKKKIPLVIHDRFHSIEQSVLSLFNSVYEPFCAVYFLLDE